MKLLIPALFVPLMSLAQNYTAEKAMEDSIEIVRLADAARRMEVRIAPSLGNNSYSIKVNGQEILFSPYKTRGEWKAKPAQAGNPFLSPWVTASTRTPTTPTARSTC